MNGDFEFFEDVVDKALCKTQAGINYFWHKGVSQNRNVFENCKETCPIMGSFCTYIFINM